MIGTLDIKVAAHNPNFPLEPVFTFINSAQSFRIMNVPRRIGKWNIEKVFVNLSYPDNTTITKECVLNGNIWIGTVEGCAESGTSTNGFIVTASGIDEDGNNITNYVLGAGDLYVKDLDGTIDPERVGTKMYFNDTLPENPKKGDATFIDSVLNVYDGTNWVPVAVSPDPSFIIDADGNKIYADRTVEVVEQGGQTISDELALKSDLPTKTSDLTNDSGFITSADVPTKTSDLTNDSGFITLAQVPTPSYIEDANGNKIEANRTATSLGSYNWWQNDTLKMEGTKTNSFYENSIEKDTLIFDNGQWTLTRYLKSGAEWVVANTQSLSQPESATELNFNQFGILIEWKQELEENTLALESDLPTKTSDLSNDSGFITTDEVLPFHNPTTPTVNTGLADKAYRLSLNDPLNPLADSSFMTTYKTKRDLTDVFAAGFSIMTYWPYELTQFNGQTYDPSLELKFCNDKLTFM